MAKSQKEIEKELQSEREAILAQEKVKITIPRDRNNPAKHVWVSVNGQEFYLAVGKPIEVPRVVAEVWQDSYNRTIEAEQNMEKFSEI
ncbi:hypothetical protein [Fictibacillus gelatini]|uniref:hypothetical protein n=1 Tax=Fictibacillus gelatini TaxID=225985 RepID=UPI0004159F78|nr:hypothetical protein [Fictibacillus gelatini]